MQILFIVNIICKLYLYSLKIKSIFYIYIYFNLQLIFIFSFWDCTIYLSVNQSSAGQRGGAAVPMTPWPSATFPTSTAEPVQLQMVQHLEKLSLVDVANEEGLSRLNYTIR